MTNLKRFVLKTVPIMVKFECFCQTKPSLYTPLAQSEGATLIFARCGYPELRSKSFEHPLSTLLDRMPGSEAHACDKFI